LVKIEGVREKGFRNGVVHVIYDPADPVPRRKWDPSHKARGHILMNKRPLERAAFNMVG